MAEICKALTASGEALPSPATSADIGMMLDAMKGMAVLLRAMNERVQSLEEQVRRLEKVTPAQAASLNAVVRRRAETVCQAHRAAGCEKAAAAAIRKAIRTTCGIASMRDLPRCDYGVAARQIDMWDDYAVMKRIRAKGAQA